MDRYGWYYWGCRTQLQGLPGLQLLLQALEDAALWRNAHEMAQQVLRILAAPVGWLVAHHNIFNSKYGTVTPQSESEFFTTGGTVA